MNIGKFLGGIVILFIGLLFLFMNFGLIEPETISSFWRYWPIIIVIIGLSVVFKAMPKPLEVSFNVLLSLAMIAGLAFIFVDAIGKKQEKIISDKTSAKQIAEPINEESEKAKIEINTGASVFKLSGGSSLLIEGQIESIFGSPTISRQMISQDKTDFIKISQDTRFWGGNWRKNSSNNWNLKINDELKSELSLNAGASKIDVDLNKTNNEKLDINAGASTINLDLGSSAENSKVNISAGASTINLKLPQTTGLAVRLDAGLTSNNFESKGLAKNDKSYTTSDFDKAGKKIELVIGAGASTINLDRY